MFKKNRHSRDSWNWIIHPWITNRKPQECLPAINLSRKDLVTELQYHTQMCFSRPWRSLTCLICKGLSYLKHYIKKSCFYTDPTLVGSKNNKAGLTAIVVRVLTAAGKATSFHDLPGKQQAACKAVRQHLTQDDNTQSSSCASDGSPGFTANKSKQTALSSF